MYCKRRKSGAWFPERKARNCLYACHCIAGHGLPLPFYCSDDGDSRKELSGLTGGPLHSLVDCLQRVIMLDNAPSTVKAFIAAFKRWHRWATELMLPTLPAKAPHVAMFLLHLAKDTSSYEATTQSVAALRWMHEKTSVADPDKPPFGQTATPEKGRLCPVT